MHPSRLSDLVVHDQSGGFHIADLTNLNMCMLFTCLAFITSRCWLKVKNK
jgi:hypothetical protein